MYLVGAVCGGAGMLVTYLSNGKAALLGVAVLVAMLAAIAWLERAPYERQKAKNDQSTPVAQSS